MLGGHRVSHRGALVVATVAVLMSGVLGCRSTSATVRKPVNCAPNHAELRKPEVGPDEPVERTLKLEQSCRAGRGGGCWTLKSAVVRIRECAAAGDGTARDFLDRACEARCAEACLGRAEVVAQSWSHISVEPTRTSITDALRRAFPFYERACEVGHPDACAYVGWMTRDGIGTPPNPARGSAILARGCKEFRRKGPRFEDHGAACSHLADSYADGRGVPRSVAKARELHHVVCVDRFDCDELYLVSSSTMRLALWVVELCLVLLANAVGLSAFFTRSRDMGSADRDYVRSAIAIGGVFAAVFMAVEIAYFFWGSSVSSPLWLLLAIPLSMVPLVGGFGRRSRASASTNEPA